MAYAETTRVSVGKSRADIEAMLRRAKASRIIHVDEPQEAIVMFMLGERLIKIVVPLAGNTTDQVRRARWRALYLIIKAKLEAVEQRITTIEEEFLPHVVMPNGETVAQWFGPQLATAYERGIMPASPLLLEGPKSPAPHP